MNTVVGFREHSLDSLEASLWSDDEEPEEEALSESMMLLERPRKRTLEEKLHATRDSLCEKVPFLEGIIGDHFDVKIGIAQGIGSIIPTVAVNLAFLLTPAAAASYIGIMAGRYFVSFASLIGAYVGVHYLLNDDYKGNMKELFREAIKFTTVARGTFIPTRAISLAFETLLVGTLGWSRYLVGNLVSPLFTTFQGMGCNYSGKNMIEGYTMGAAIKQGFMDLGNLCWEAIKLPYTLGKKAYDYIFDREPALPYPLDEPEEYIADWHASRIAITVEDTLSEEICCHNSGCSNPS